MQAITYALLKKQYMYTKRTQEQNRYVSLKGLSHDMDLAFGDM
jgi:hypothetical protein